MSVRPPSVAAVAERAVLLRGRELLFRCPGVDRYAVRGVDLDLHAGELVVVCGENGAGKSTLLKMMVGLSPLHEGQLWLDEQPVAWRSPADARAAGIAMVEQHLALATELDAVENLALLGSGLGWVQRSQLTELMRTQEQRLTDVAQPAVTLDLQAPIDRLPLGQRQKIELMRALVNPRTRVLVLDEPTAVLLPHEAESLYRVLRSLVEGPASASGAASAGLCVVVVTHRLGEVAQHADRVVVMTRGKKVHDAPFDRSIERELALAPITRVVFASGPKPAAPPPPASAEVTAPLRLSVKALGCGALRSASFELRAGEVLGVAGSEGNGQAELFSLLSGQREPETGTLSAVTRAHLVPDRHAQGLLLDASIADNVLLGDHRTLGFMLSKTAVAAAATARLARVFGEQVPDLEAPISTLSGGNQQKVMLARTLARAAGVGGAGGQPFLLLAEPTRGIDAGAQAEVHQVLRELVADGMAMVVISADLDELRALCTKLVVLERGVCTAPLPPDVPDEVLAAAMLGTSRAEQGS